MFVLNGAARRRLPARCAAAAAAAAMLLAPGSPARAAPVPGVEPKSVERTVAPGEAFDVGKVVQTPTILPTPDVVLLVDTAGSMGQAIENVKSNILQVIDTIRTAQPEAHFAVASYRGVADGPELFQVHQGLTGDAGKVKAAVDGLSTGGGEPEDWINALVEVAGLDFRDDGSPVVVLIGDSPSHEPSNEHGYAEAETALQSVGARFVAVDVETDLASSLDKQQQATHLVTATGGQLLNPSPEQVSAAILSGLRKLDVQVTPKVMDCDPALDVYFDAAEVTVPGGGAAKFAETVEVSAGATDGATLNCTVRFDLGGVPAGQDFGQHITIHVLKDEPPVVTVEDKTVEATGPDGAVMEYPASAVDDLDGKLFAICEPPPGSVFPIGNTEVACAAEDSGGNVGKDTATMRVVDTTAPVATCTPGGNPAGNPPKPDNPDGFSVIGGKDLADPGVRLYIRDTGDVGVNFGPYTSGTTIKLTQAPGAKPEVKPGAGDVGYKVRLRGDAQIVAVDAANNVSAAATCSVPPKP